MGRSALTEEDVETFRREIRKAAQRRLAAHGPSGVTMRGLAEDLGCSPMTPYRYFRDKEEIITMVRAAAHEAFANAQKRAFDTEADPIRRLRALAEAYVRFAIDEPDLYGVMFQLDQRRGGVVREIDRQVLRAWNPTRETLREAINRGMLRGDAEELGHIYWSAIHGLVSLHLAGKLRLGRSLASLVGPLVDHMIAGARPDS